MHELFADWYRQVDLQAGQEQLTNRWQCVEAGVQALNADSILGLVRICFGVPSPGDEPEADGASIASTFKEVDVTFPMKNNKQLLRVMFGATLVQCIENDSDGATLAALAVCCAHCKGLAAVPVVEELLGVAKARLDTLGRSKRSGGLKTPVVVPKLTKSEMAELPTTVTMHETSDQSHWPHVQKNFQSLSTWMSEIHAVLESLRNAHVKMRSETASGLRRNSHPVELECRISVLKEECDVLWWLFGERSDIVGPWDRAKPDQLCLLVGAELGGLTSFDEPVPNAEDFLSKALSRMQGSTESAHLEEAIESAPVEWRKAQAALFRRQLQRCGGVVPVHSGMGASVNTVSWVEQLKEMVGIPLDTDLPALLWAMQVYQETLLLQLLENEDG